MNGLGKICGLILALALGFGASPLLAQQTLNLNPKDTLTQTTGTFTISPDPRFNVVAIARAAGSTTDVTMTMGAASSTAGVTRTEFVVANGALGPIAPLNGTASKTTSGGNALVKHANITTFMDATGGPTSPGNTPPYSGAFSWSPCSVARGFEMHFPVAGTYQLTMTVTSAATTALRFRLFDPGSNSNWRTRSQSAPGANGLFSSGAISFNVTTPGWYCVVVFKDNQPITPPNVFYNLDLQVLSAPPLANTPPAAPWSPNPSVVHFTGIGLWAGTSVMDSSGQILTSTPSASGGLNVTIPGSPVSTCGGPISLTFTNNLAGAQSCIVPLAIDPQGPASIVSFSPSTLTAGAPATAIQVLGTGFCPNSVVQVDNNPYTTTFVGPTALGVTLLASDLASPTTIQITVMTPGAGTSQSLAFNVVPVLPSVAYPGTGEDFRMDVGINSAPMTPSISGFSTVQAGDILNLNFLSPNGTINNSPFFIFARAYLTGTPTPMHAMYPNFIYIDSAGVIIQDDNSLFGVPVLLPASNLRSFLLPSLPAGVSVMLQSVAVRNCHLQCHGF
ncbi:MAG: hypothetical protein V3W41_02760 [Planctomycetota bacterium]